MVLFLDIGNTRIKGAVYEADELKWQFVTTQEELPETLSQTLAGHAGITDMVVASVGAVEKEQLQAFAGRINLHFISRHWRFPFRNLYATPETLGLDRMVLAAGSVLRYPAQNRLVIDAGTCVTYDFTDSDDRYHGGAISPGLRMRYRALHDYTARLPLLEPEFPSDFVGDSTAASIHSGVVNGLLQEIDGTIDSYRKRWPNFIIILTGGDGEFLAKRLKNTIFANSNFLLESLNRTFQFILND